MTITDLAPYVVPVLMLAMLLGALWAFRRAALRELGAIQEQVVAAYKEQNEAQARQIKRLRAENVAMHAAFRQLGVDIEIIDEHEIILTQRESGGRRTRITKVQVAQDSDDATKEKEKGA